MEKPVKSCTGTMKNQENILGEKLCEDSKKYTKETIYDLDNLKVVEVKES